jgi:hypothetical protein
MDKEKIDRRLGLFHGVLFGSFICVALTFADKIPGIDDINLGFNKQFEIPNSQLIFTVSMIINLTYFSFVGLLIILLFGKKDFYSIFPVSGIFLFWFTVLLHCFFNFSDHSGKVSLVSIITYTIVGLAFITLIISYLYNRKKVHAMENLEKFKERALKKFSKLNPEHNQKLLEDLLGNHGRALNLLLAAHEEENEKDKQELTRLALHETFREKDSILKLQKRMQMYAKIPGK